MLEIEKSMFEIKFAEIHLRQRMYEKKSFVTVLATIEFYPTIVLDNVVEGSIEIKLDLSDITSLNDLSGKEYQGDIGNVTISVNNDGVWEHQSYDEFSMKFGKLKGRKIEFSCQTANCKLETTGTLVSLYTTTTGQKYLEKEFCLDQFYPNPIVKKIGSNEVYKYYVKDEKLSD